MAIIIETCPKCGHDLHDLIIATYPPIPKKECWNCGWSWEGEREEIIRIPFGGNILNVNEPTKLEDYTVLNANITDDVDFSSVTTLNGLYNFGNKIDDAIENTISHDELDRINQEFKNLFIRDSFEQSACVHCSNNPKNGGSGVCFCTLGQMEIT